MTGYARTAKSGQIGNIDIIIKSVNNKNCEVTVKSPKILFELENEIINKVKQKLQRGKIYVFISITNCNDKKIVLNKCALKQYISEIKSLQKELTDYVFTVPEICSLMQLPEIIEIESLETDITDFKKDVFQVLDETLEKIDKMRINEGINLLMPFLSYINQIKNFVEIIKKEVPVSLENYKIKLEKLLNELYFSCVEDKEKKIMAELGLYADKIDITEEIDRLSSHLDECEKLLNNKSSEPVGRTLEFLVQELNREINTSGVKSNNYVISQAVINVKSLIDKIKEQSMNIV